jgi:hypothetical protein
MQDCKCLIRFPTHTSHIHVIGDRIHVFKYSLRSCDFEVFSAESEQELAGDYAVDPMTAIQYRVVIPGEDSK